METFDDKYNLLKKKLQKITEQQDFLSQEIIRLKHEIAQFERQKEFEHESIIDDSVKEIQPKKEAVLSKQPQPVSSQKPIQANTQTPLKEKWVDAVTDFQKKENVTKEARNLESFIGGNLMSKIGIVILILGIGLGVKYAIDKELINQVTRIILGYIAGIGLVGLSIWLKKKYFDYSAILASGALAIMYYTTFVAYSYYALFPQLVAFGIMLLVTLTAIYFALQYNKEIIALFGQVGAYAIPLLLSDESGNEKVLFSYIAIINMGVLFLAFKKNWRVLYYAAFAITWLLLGSWFFETYDFEGIVYSTLFFIFLFFVIFYAMLIINHVKFKTEFERENLWILRLNAFLFFVFGLLVLDQDNTNSDWYKWFPFLSAILHLIAAGILFSVTKKTDKLFRYIIGIAIALITIAAPFILKNEFTTIFWMFEVFVLAYFGMKNNFSVFKKYAKWVLVVALCGLLNDWGNRYFFNVSANHSPIFNLTFATSLLMIGLLVYLTFRRNKLNFIIEHNKKYEYANIIPAILLMVTFFTFCLEINKYWTNQIAFDWNDDFSFSHENWNLFALKNLSLLNYGMFFTIALAFLNQLKIKDKTLAIYNFFFSFVTILMFVIVGFEELDDLTRCIWVRYASYVLFGLTLFVIYRYVQLNYYREVMVQLFKVLFHIAVLTLLSFELIHLLDLFQIKESNKLGLSILWGIYAFGLMVFGIWKKEKEIRIGAIILFAITLIKVFVYDLSDMNMISKIIIFIVLGVLLLVISYLYNKFKHKLFDA